MCICVEPHRKGERNDSCKDLQAAQPCRRMYSCTSHVYIYMHIQILRLIRQGRGYQVYMTVHLCTVPGIILEVEKQNSYSSLLATQRNVVHDAAVPVSCSDKEGPVLDFILPWIGRLLLVSRFRLRWMTCVLVSQSESGQ